jgi:hypothetical protein
MRAAHIILALLFLSGCQNPPTPPSKENQPGMFTDITKESNLNFVHDPAVEGNYFYPEVMGAGGAFFDYDNDGDLDIYLANGAYRASGRPKLTHRLFRQDKNGKFIDVTETSRLADTGYGMGVAMGDIDNDGDVDVYVANYGPNKLYQNNGDGTFIEITKQAGITNSAWATAAVFFDYNRDGFLDIFIANYVTYDPAVVCSDKSGKRDYCGPQAYLGEKDVLYRNNGNGTFTDVSDASGISKIVSKGLGVVAADFDMDSYPDLYVANDGEPNQLWMNQRNGTFVDVAVSQGAAVNAAGQAEAGMGIAVGDIDGDADEDLFITHLRNETNTLYRNVGKLGFQDDTASSGIAAFSLAYTGFGTGWFDYDQDGDLDVAVVNGRVTRGPLLTKNNPPKYWDHYTEPNLLYENDGSGKFTAKHEQAGPFCSDIENSRGLAFGDVDNDGDVDLLVTNDGGPARLYRNDLKQKGHWLMVQAKDPALKRNAIGANITILVEGKKIFRSLSPGYSYLSYNDPRVHFGLGKATSVKQIIVKWPDGTSETFPGIKADQFIVLEKGKGTASK